MDPLQNKSNKVINIRLIASKPHAYIYIYHFSELLQDTGHRSHDLYFQTFSRGGPPDPLLPSLIRIMVTVFLSPTVTVKSGG